MEEKRPLILITNDDGLGTGGLNQLIDIAVRLGDVVVVAPAEPQSGKSSAITVNQPLYVDGHPSVSGAAVFSATARRSTA